MILNCLECGQPFHTVPALIKRGGGKYCSKTCSGVAHRTLLTRNCLRCGKPFTVKPATVKMGGGKYCSRECHHLHRSDNINERFWAQVEKTDTCWIWKGHIVDNGYGHMSLRGTTLSVHRYSYEQTYGPIPIGLFVCHHCDNKACIRPDHLFLGTTNDNMADMVSKGRQRYGDTHPQRKLSSTLVETIRRRYASGNVSQNQLALEYNVTKTNIRYVVHARTWRHI